MARPARKEYRGTQKGDRVSLVLDWEHGTELRLALIETDQKVKALITALLQAHLADYVRKHRVLSRKDAEKIFARRNGPRLV
jgi:hypothetical protein